MLSMLHWEWPGDEASDKTDKGCGNLVIFFFMGKFCDLLYLEMVHG